MLTTKKARGATARQDNRHRHLAKPLLIAGLVFAGVTLTAISSDEKAAEDRDELSTLLHNEQVAAEISTAATTELPEATANTNSAPVPSWDMETVKRGDNLAKLFKRAGFSDRDMYRFVNEAPQGKALGKLYPGQSIGFLQDDGGKLIAVKHVVSALDTVVYRETAAGFERTQDLRTPEIRQAWASAEIESSLFMAGKDAGMSSTTIMDLAHIFGGVIDFVLDPRKGDQLYVMYEEQYLDGEKYADGEIIAATFINQGETFRAFRYEDSQGDTGYYNEDGVSMRKAFLMAPVDFTRISSNFNLRRLHPIYKTRRPHRGTDYAAPTGTPVYAAGDGRVIKAGYTRANGNYVFIQHGDQYVTRYLHLHKRRVKTGQRVSQSQVIGTVGATGAATGPHLHYEFLVNGVHRNPRTIHKQLPKAKALPEAELPLFQQAILGASSELTAMVDAGQSTEGEG